MSRVEENLEVLNFLTKDMKTSGTYEEMVIWSLGSICSLIADISKSMAIIADNNVREVDEIYQKGYNDAVKGMNKEVKEEMNKTCSETFLRRR